VPHPLVEAGARANLCFHDITDTPDNIYGLPMDYLLAVLDGLRAEGIADRVRVYFDDGYASVTAVVARLRQAYPEVELVLALTLDFLDKPGFIGAAEVPTLHQAGAMISAHGREHLHMAQLADDQILTQLRASHEAFDRYGSREFVLPYGSYDERLLEINERHRLYDFIATVDYGWDRGQLLRPRLIATSEITPAGVISRLAQPA